MGLEWRFLQELRPLPDKPRRQKRKQPQRSISGGTAASGRHSGQPPEILMAIVRKVWYMFGSQGDDDDGK